MNQFNSLKKRVWALLLFSTLFASAIQASCIIYVTTTAPNNGLGTADNPTSLATAMQIADGTEILIKLAGGTYNLTQSLSMKSGVTLEGGYNATTWAKTSAASYTIINRQATGTYPYDGTTNAPAFIAVKGSNINYFRIQDITLSTDDAPIPAVGQVAASTYAIQLSGCNNYIVARCNLEPGNAANGRNGTDGITGASGGNGANGSTWQKGAGGSSPCGCNGGEGGNGANNGTYAVGGKAGYCGNGTAGSNGTNTGGTQAANGTGVGYGGGAGNNGSNFWGCSYPASGRNGGDGSNGADGSSGSSGTVGVVSGGLFIPGSSGGNGLKGNCGVAGGGGGGGGEDSSIDIQSDEGGGGGGGGGGGEGGNAGTGGGSGGASIAAMVVSNGSNTKFTDCSFYNGNAGTGGIGGVGASGGNGGVGGNGASGIDAPCDAGNGGSGGRGGNGGKGGNGGNGSTGLSTQLYFASGTAPSVIALGIDDGVVVGINNLTNFDGVNQPIISVSNSACAKSIVTYTSSSAGTWDFGPGATPSTVYGDIVSTSYSTLGAKSVTFNGQVYTNFVTLIKSLPQTPQMQSTATVGVNGQYQICEGETYTFSTTNFGGNYRWNFGGAIQPTVQEGPGLQVISVTFNTPGQFLITLSVDTECCGTAPSDSAYMTVIPANSCCDVPENPRELSVTATSASIAWDPVATATQYEVRGGIAGRNILGFFTTNSYRSFNSNFIKPNKTYQWQVRARCGNGSWSAFTAWRYVSTPSLKPGEVYDESQYDENLQSEEPILMFTLAPNPASSVCDVLIDEPVENAQLQVANLNGQIVQTHSFSGNSFRLDVSDLPTGMYILMISTPTQREVQKLIVR
jgi:hypothetical protein